MSPVRVVVSTFPLLTLTITLLSLLAFTFVRVNTVVSPSPKNVSDSIVSNAILKGSKCVVDPFSQIKESSVNDKSSSVPDSN